VENRRPDRASRGKPAARQGLTRPGAPVARAASAPLRPGTVTRLGAPVRLTRLEAHDGAGQGRRGRLGAAGRGEVRAAGRCHEEEGGKKEKKAYS
jgi:hypothetical protein